MTLNEFIDATASSAPVPGGGSISALCGSLATALGKMVCGLTAGRKKYAEVEDEVNKISLKIGSMLHVFTESIQLDAEAYDQVFQAYKMPKDTEQDRLARSEMIQTALVTAANVPMSVASAAANIMSDLKRLAEIGNKNAITDIYVASLCARTAALGASANVSINLLSITDEAFVEKNKKKLLEIEASVNSEAEAIERIVMKEIR